MIILWIPCYDRGRHEAYLKRVIWKNAEEDSLNLDKTDESKIFQRKTIKIITSIKIMNSTEL